jgi:hypothetical protein
MIKALERNGFIESKEPWAGPIHSPLRKTREYTAIGIRIPIPGDNPSVQIIGVKPIQENGGPMLWREYDKST